MLWVIFQNAYFFGENQNARFWGKAGKFFPVFSYFFFKYETLVIFLNKINKK